jgi:hypothetical protein
MAAGQEAAMKADALFERDATERAIWERDWSG